jgi:uncharacterized membrane protein (UPF0127 family)
MSINTRMSINNKTKLAIIIFLLGLTILLVASCTYLHKNANKELPEKKIPLESVKPVDKAKFIKEGKVIFFSKETKKKIIQIDVEIADNPDEIATGLMYRHSMPDKAGMLFIYEETQPLAFWMKNTYIPLDIIFVDENMQIVTIQKNTKPLSEKLILSDRDSMYVVEVNAGFCDKYFIKIGDYLSYERTLY